MFIAKASTGKIVSLINQHNLNIMELKKESPFYCPACKEEVILKIGRKKLSHFAHRNSCPIKPEGESEIHLQGKYLLHKWLINQGLHPQLEYYLPELNQRPDVFVKWGNDFVAFEFQCSVIPLEDLEKRSKNYTAHNIKPFWILYDKLITKYKQSVLEISDFVSHFLHDFHSAQRYILCLSPESETFISYTNIIPYSLNRAYFTSNYFKIDVPLHKIVNQYSKPFAFYESWIESSENWLYFLPLQKNSMKNYFLQYLYRHHIHPLNLPPEVGVPVPNMEILKTPPIVWQAYIWLHFLYKNEQESVFSINDLERYVFHTMKKSIIFRNTIHISRKNRLQPILNYLDLLCKLQMIKRQEGYFIINKKANLIDHPNTMREGLRKDFFRKYKAVIINNLVLTDK